MRRVRIGVQKGDVHRLDAALHQGLADGAQTRYVERLQHLALVIKPLCHFETQVARDQRLVRAFQPVHGRSVTPAEF